MPSRAVVAVFLSLALVAGLARAADPAPPAPAPGAAHVDRDALAALRAAAPGAETRIVLRWSAPAAQRGEAAPREITTTLRRIEVYAPDARVLEATAEGYRELPRDRRLHFVGIGTVGQRFGLSLDPDGGAAEGILLRDGRMYALQGATDDAGLALAARDMDAPLPDGEVAVGSCSGSLSPGDLGTAVAPAKAGAQSLDDGIGLGGQATTRRPLSFAPKVATRQVTIAVDTDNEFLQRKFANNTANATNYVAGLFTALNAIYEDDPAQYGLQLRLVQGTVILRPSTTADPFNNTDTNATGAALNEFGTYWQNNQAAVARAFALLLSGKSSNQNSASGIAWVITSGTYCTRTASTGGHYSVNQVFWNPNLPAAQDAYLVAHELGHNLGAFHTHCASSANGGQASTGTIDRCFNGESVAGCYAGPQSCPSGAESPVAPQGTLMSYCHLNGLNCGVSTEIHPTHVSQLNGRLASQPTSCVAPISSNSAPAVAIESGSVAYAESATAVLVSPGATASDADGNWSGGSLAVAISGGASGDDRLSINTGGGLSIAGGTLSLSGTAFATLAPAGGVVSGATSLTATFNANATNARVQALVRAIQFANVSELPVIANRNVAFTLRDGASATATGASSRIVTVSSVNDAPTASTPASINGLEDQPLAIAGVAFGDVDAGNAPVLATFGVPAGTLSATGTALVIVGGNVTSRTLTGSIADLNAFLAANQLTYTGAPNASGGVALSVSINDQGNSGGGGPQSANGSTTLQIAAANDAPTVSAPASLSVLAGAGIAVSPVSYADIDAPAGNIAVVATYAAGSGTFSATAAGGVSVVGSGAATLTLSGTLSAINAFLAATPVQYTASAAASGIVPLTLTINDQGNTGAGGALAGSATVNVSVTAADTFFASSFEP